MRPRTITPGIYMLTAACGLIDAATFLALGGVFAEIMTGNIMFLAFDIGQGGGWEVVPRFLVPLVTFSLGAVVCGFLLMSPRFGTRRRHPFVVIAVFVAIATILALLWNPGSESTEAMIVVGVLSFAMGLQNAAVLYHAVPDVATNVMTLTLTALLAESRLGEGSRANVLRRVMSIACFFSGGVIAAALVHFGTVYPLGLAALLYALAIVPLILGEKPQQERTA